MSAQDVITIVDYGMGNLRSVAKAVESRGGRAIITDEPGAVQSADKLILPGVGAFADAMDNLRGRGLIDPIRRFIDAGRPFLGICLGLQLLFEKGFEDGPHEGLGVLAGQVVRFDFSGLPAGHDLAIPHMGWNAIRWERNCPLFTGLPQGCYVYFVHSFHVVPSDDSVRATSTDYGYSFTSSVWKGNVMATQFHPEKSQAVGLRMITNFVNL